MMAYPRFTPCYGCPQRMLREELWHSLKELSVSINSPCLVVGDFNSVLFDYEIIKAASDHKSYSSLRDYVDFCNLVDAGF